MKRVQQAVTIGVLVACVAVMTACHGDTRITYVNENTNERLELFPSRTLKNVAISAFHGAQLGYYNLGKPDQEIVRGGFVWRNETINLEPSTSCSFSDQAESDSELATQGRCATIVLKFAEDGSLRGGSGNIWKPAIVDRLVLKAYSPSGSN